MASGIDHVLVYYIALPVLSALVAAAVIAIVTTLVSRRLAETKASEEKRLEGAKQIGEVYDLMAGKTPTALEPDPAPGLRQVVAETRAKLEEVALGLMAVNGRVEKIEFTLTTNGFKHDTVLDNLQQIRHNTTAFGTDGKPIVTPLPPEEGPPS